MRTFGRPVVQMAKFLQLLQQPVIGRLGANLGHFHEFRSVGIKFVGKEVKVPIEEQCHVQADMPIAEPGITIKVH